MGLINSLAITDSALTAERMQMDVIANNVANADTTRTAEGGPYKAEEVVFAPANVATGVADAVGAPVGIGMGAGMEGAGVQVAAVVQDTRPPRLVYDPGNPGANRQGYVAYCW